MTDLSFVSDLYRNVLFREPDTSGTNFWVNQLTLGGVSRDTVRAAFINSSEADTFVSPIIRLYENILGRAPDAAGLNAWSQALRSGTQTLSQITAGFLNSAEGVAAGWSGAGVTGTAFVTKIYTAMGRSAAQISADTGAASWAAALNNGTLSPAAVAIAINESAENRANVAGFVTGYEALRSFGIAPTTAQLQAFSNTATTAQIVTAASTVTDSTTLPGGSGGTSGQTFALTSGVDNIVGTATNNTIDGSRVVLQGQVLNSLNNSDSIDGGAGTDTLFVQMSEGVDITPASLKNVEIVSVENLNAGARVLNLTNGDASITTVKSANNVSGVSITNIQSAPTAYELSTTAQAFTASVLTAKLAGTTDAATLLLTNVTGAAAVALGNTAATGGNGYETISITSSGTVANSITLDDTPGGAAAGSLATIKIAGSNDLTLASVTNMTTVTTVDASTFTGKLTYTAAATNGQNMTVTGGTGNDVIDVQGYTSSDIINGGAGTDRLILTNAEAIAATAVQSNVSNIEILQVSGLNGTVSATNFGATGVRLGAALGGAATISYSAGTDSLDLQDSASGGSALIATIAGTATTDVLNVTVGSATAGNTFGGGAVTINGAETVNLTTQGGASTFGSTFTITDTAATQSLIITGNQSITFTGAVRADVVNASGLTGSATLTLTAGTGSTATAITGTANADTLIGSTAGDIINGGAGNDAISNRAAGNATAGDVLTGGTGNDTFTLYGDAASAAVATAYAAASQITDFTVGASTSTTDILALSATTGNYSGASALFAGIATAAAGSTAIQTVAQNAAATAIVTGTDLIKLTTAVDTTGLTVQQAFNTAIGTATVTGLTANNDIFVSFYDSANSRMVVGVVDAGGGATTTVVETADTITLVGTINMTAADYVSFSNTHLAIVA